MVASGIRALDPNTQPNSYKSNPKSIQIGDRNILWTGPVTRPKTGDREGSGHSNLTYSFVGNAGVKFREGCRLSNLTHPFTRAMQWENLDKEVALPTSLTLLWAMQG